MVALRNRIVLALLLFIPAFGINTATALEVISTSPEIDATLVVAPNFVSVTVDQELLELGNEMIVISPSNERVDDGLITVSGNTLSVGMTELSESGKYLVEYELLVADESPIFGNFSFTFQAPPVIDEASESPSPIDGEDSGEEPREIGSSATDYLVIGLLVLAFFILLWLARFARTTFRKE